jgi:hypothetical protein
MSPAIDWFADSLPRPRREVQLRKRFGWPAIECVEILDFGPSSDMRHSRNRLSANARCGELHEQAPSTERSVGLLDTDLIVKYSGT